jgi:ABC-type phosphate transport system permease subunit
MKDLLQISGAVVITVGALLIAIPAGLIVGGVFLVLIGLSLER